VSHPLLARLRDPDPDARRAACREAPDDPSAVLLVDALCAALADPQKPVARAASEALARIGARHGGVQAALSAALRGGEPRARLYAALAIARLEPPPIKLLPALIDALALADGDLRFAAARLLVDLGRLQPEVLALLLSLVAARERPEVRRMAAFALRELAPDREETARALLEASRDGDPALRRAALASLAALWEPGAAVLARLCEALDGDPDAAARALAAAALGELGAAHPRHAARAREALDAAARDGAPPAREAAARALRRLAP
jgi:hypothetical protein